MRKKILSLCKHYPVFEVPLATASNTNGVLANGIIITVSSAFDATFKPYYLLDKTSLMWITTNGVSTGTANIQFPGKKFIFDSITIGNSNSNLGFSKTVNLYTDSTRAKKIGATGVFPATDGTSITYTPTPEQGSIVTSGVFIDILNGYGVNGYVGIKEVTFNNPRLIG